MLLIADIENIHAVRESFQQLRGLFLLLNREGPDGTAAAAAASATSTAPAATPAAGADNSRRGNINNSSSNLPFDVSQLKPGMLSNSSGDASAPSTGPAAQAGRKAYASHYCACALMK